MRRWIATRLRFLADRIDPFGAPRRINWSFRIFKGEGLKFEEGNDGCSVWYYGRDDYARAFQPGGDWWTRETVAAGKGDPQT